LYLDDGETYAYEKAEYLKGLFHFENGVLSYNIAHSSAQFASTIASVRVERLVILGQVAATKAVATDAAGSRELQMEETKNGKIVVRDPAVLITENGWKIELS
jgi:hypothetical protein